MLKSNLKVPTDLKTNANNNNNNKSYLSRTKIHGHKS